MVRDHDATRKALSETRDRLSIAQDAVGSAAAAVETAKQNAVSHLTATAMGQAGIAPVSIKTARAELQEANDNLETLQSTARMLEVKLKAYESGLDWPKQCVEYQISEVIRSEVNISKLLSEYEELRVQLGQCRSVLLWLGRRPAARPEEGVMFEYRHFEHRPAPEIDEAACVAPWELAVKELASNSDAPLPVV